MNDVYEYENTDAASDPPGEDGAVHGPAERHRIDIGGNAGGPVIAGNYNMVIDAQHGSRVTMLTQGERPLPVRRDRVALLPRRQPAPLGRDTELAALAAAVRAGGPVQLWGPPGVGKSTVLRYAAQRLDPGPDGVLFLSAAHREVEDLTQEVFEACYEAAGYAPASAELRRLMAGVRITVYVDNAALSPEQVRELLDAAPDATFVFAGRDRSLLGEGTALQVHGLDRAAAFALLARELGRALTGNERTAADLWKTATGRPLLLLHAAALARLDSSGEPKLPAPGAVAELLPLILERLNTAAVNVLRLLTTLEDAELAPVHIGTLAGVPDPVRLCDTLTGLGLAETTERGYRCAPGTVSAVRGRYPEPFPGDRLCEHFAHWAALPGTTPAEVADHARALEISAELAERSGRADLAIRVARAAAPALAQSLRFGVWGRVLGAGRSAADAAADPQARAYFTHEQGVRTLVTGRRVVSAVLLAEAALLWRQLGNGQGADAAAGAQQLAPSAPTVPDTPPDPTGSLDPTSPTAPADSPQPDPTAGADPTTNLDPTTVHGPTTSPDPTTSVDPTTGPDLTSVDPNSALEQGTSHTGPDLSTTHSGTGPDVSTGPDLTTGPDLSTGPDFSNGPGPDFSSGPDFTTGPDPVFDPSPAADQLASQGSQFAQTVPAAGSPPPMPPPGAVEASSAASGIGGTATGATAAAGAAAGGASALTGILTAIAVVLAVAIGGVAVSQQDSGDEPAATETGLAGTWRDSEGGTSEIEQTGSSTYTTDGTSPCGEAYTTEITGSGGSYSATGPLYDVGTDNCESVGTVDVTITMGADTDVIQVVKELSADVDTDEVECYDCGTYTLNRVP
ncbi:ATP-binding protein [Streptomyces sp. NA04227]|uniref:ATP-binding protein n=1 Tax=Streptomyces sp. NA04227 TaxID=2742136 RepID=UPI0015920CA2|nr:ATP-binding protein [Streptomyces sp. NA04227]QKW10095.1 ATP-binding protein [Streptomyces sp. NA04227]